MYRYIIILLLSSELWSCTYQLAEPVPVGNFPGRVSAILQNNCLGGDCHSRATTLNTGFDLSSWDAMTKGSIYFNEIIPFNAAKSHLMGHISTVSSLAPPISPTMPIARDPLPASDQRTLFDWINDGAKSEFGKIPYSNTSKKIFIANQNEDMISVIDAETQRLVRLPYIGLNSQPSAILMMPDLKTYLVAINGAIAKFDAATYAMVGKFTTNFSSGEIAVTPDGSKGYMVDASYDGNKFAVFDPIEMTFTKSLSSSLITDPFSVTVSPDGKCAYICGHESDNILRIDTKSDSITGWFTLGPSNQKYAPQKVVISADSKILYVTCQSTSEVVVFDLAKDSIIARVHTPSLPYGAALTPDGSELWVAGYGSNTVNIVSTASNSVVGIIDSVSQYPRAMAFTPDGAYAYVACELSAGGVHHHVTGGAPPSSYVVIDCKTRKILSIQELPALSTSIAIGFK